MEQLEEDGRGPMRQEKPLHVKGNIHKMIVQSAIGPTVRDGDSANDQHPSEENGSDRDEEDCLDGHAATH